MLSFNPYFRPSAVEILRNKLFDGIRVDEYEHKSHNKLCLDEDTDEQAGMEEWEIEKTRKELASKLHSLVLSYNQN